MKVDSYRWRDNSPDEILLRFGPEDGPKMLILPPLFEEANRMRRVLIELMRALGRRGIASIMPDLPGTGDSMVATVDARLADWATAIATLPPMTASVALRGGALLDGYARVKARWRLAPETGARLLRDMVRATAMSGAGTSGEVEARARTTPTRLAGNLVHPALFAALETAVLEADDTIRTVTIGDGPNDLPGTPLWRRAEPGDDPALVAAMADNIFEWAVRCDLL